MCVYWRETFFSGPRLILFLVLHVRQRQVIGLILSGWWSPAYNLQRCSVSYDENMKKRYMQPVETYCICIKSIIRCCFIVEFTASNLRKWFSCSPWPNNFSIKWISISHYRDLMTKDILLFLVRKSASAIKKNFCMYNIYVLCIIWEIKQVFGNIVYTKTIKSSYRKLKRKHFSLIFLGEEPIYDQGLPTDRWPYFHFPADWGERSSSQLKDDVSLACREP